MFPVQEIFMQGRLVRNSQTQTPLVGETQIMHSYVFIKSLYEAKKYIGMPKAHYYKLKEQPRKISGL